MAVLTIPYTFVDATTIVAAEHNSNFTAVKNFVDGLASGVNFDAGAIGTEDLGASSVSTVKIQDAAVTSAKIAAGAVGTSEIATSVTLTTPNIGVASGTSLSVSGTVTAVGNVIGHAATNAQTGTTYTLVAADDGKVVEVLNASPITLTIPLNSSVPFTIGTQILVLQTGAGQITLAGAGGVTVNATPGLKLRTQWSSATLIKRATDTWVAVGDLSA
jgi:hypothetical protein